MSEPEILAALTPVVEALESLGRSLGISDLLDRAHAEAAPTGG